VLDDAAVRTMLRAIGLYDVGLARHAALVARVSELVARDLGLSERETARVVQAALLHDLGKVEIPLAILNKPGPLEEDEWLEMRDHPAHGARLISVHRRLTTVAEAVLHHHERIDGAGYPHGLAGDEIPYVSRIVGVCDAYCAMREQRPYATALTEAEALDELWAGAGTQFDLETVMSLDRVLRSASGRGGRSPTTPRVPGQRGEPPAG
jgi:HD-GYP domain-containing protein (c-di-GMP phosphodiesterase class II)